MKAAAAVAALAFAALMLQSAEVGAAQGDYAFYEGSVRAAALKLRERNAQCALGDPMQFAICSARATAEWRKALALARASFTNARSDWDEAVRTIQEQDTRVSKMERAFVY